MLTYSKITHFQTLSDKKISTTQKAFIRARKLGMNITFKGVENGETLFFDESIAIYFFDHGKNRFEIKAFINNYNVEIISSEFNQDSELLIRSLRQGEW